MKTRVSFSASAFVRLFFWGGVLTVPRFMMNPPTHPRHVAAVARMNYLHAPYIRARQIQQEDLLYTLAVCILEPVRVVGLYEWRALNEYEVAGIATFWKGVGEEMGLDVRGLLGKGDGEWVDGIEFYDAVRAWAGEREWRDTRPCEANRGLGDALVGLFLWWVPRGWRGGGEQVVRVVMGERMRRAFMYPEPGLVATTVVHVVLLARMVVLRFLALPRFRPLEKYSAPDPVTGRINHLTYLKTPYWNPEVGRYHPVGWAMRALGCEMPKESLGSRGYLFEELGPKAKIGQGAEEMEKQGARLRHPSRSACPFARV